VYAIDPYLRPGAEPHGPYVVPKKQMDPLKIAQDCIMCGSCLSECTSREANPEYLGPAALAKAYRFVADARDGAEQERLERYSEPNGIWDCDTCLYCNEVCPMHVKPMDAIMRMREKSIELGIPSQGATHALAFYETIVKTRTDPALVKVLGCEAWSPMSIEPHHPDLFWYGVHGVETLFSLMGPGCEGVARTHAPGADVVVGRWKDGRIGVVRGTRGGPHDYGAVVHGQKGVRASAKVAGSIYKDLVREIVTFFRTGMPPVSVEEMLEVVAFMEAADESKRQGGAEVTLESVLAKAGAVK